MQEFVIGGGSGRPLWLIFFVPGLCLIALGVLILIVPRLLVALVAALLFVGGFALASLGWRLRKGAQIRPPWPPGWPGGPGGPGGRWPNP